MLNNPPKFNKGDVVDGLEITKVNLKSVDAYHNCWQFWYTYTVRYKNLDTHMSSEVQEETLVKVNNQTKKKRK